MPVRYVLQDNRLTPDPDDRYAQVIPARSVGLDEVADEIAATGSDITRSSVTRVDVVTVLGALDQAIVKLLADGANVNLPFANFGVRIQGSFADDDDQFDAARHALLPSVSAGARLREAVRSGLPLEKAASEQPAPSLRHYVDVNTAERDGALTPGGFGRLTGSRLAFQTVGGRANDQGVFFVATADGAETRVEVVGQNTPSQLQFLVPALAAGDYRVEVRSAFGEEVRAGRLGAVLSVA